jgi:hypothetical protein
MASAQLRISRRIGIDVDLCPIPGFEISTGFLIPLFHLQNRGNRVDCKMSPWIQEYLYICKE